MSSESKQAQCVQAVCDMDQSLFVKMSIGRFKQIMYDPCYDLYRSTHKYVSNKDLSVSVFV